MNTQPASSQASRRSLLDQIAAITTMQPGTLAEEWRERPGPPGEDSVRLGPYFKHQVWKDGRNLSRRVPPQEATHLRGDIDNAKRFEQLTAELAQVNIEYTLALRVSQGQSTDAQESKKNSRPKQAAKGLPKQKPSSPKPKRR